MFAFKVKHKIINSSNNKRIYVISYFVSQFFVFDYEVRRDYQVCQTVTPGGAFCNVGAPKSWRLPETSPSDQKY